MGFEGKVASLVPRVRARPYRHLTSDRSPCRELPGGLSPATTHHNLPFLPIRTYNTIAGGKGGEGGGGGGGRAARASVCPSPLTCGPMKPKPRVSALQPAEPPTTYFPETCCTRLRSPVHRLILTTRMGARQPRHLNPCHFSSVTSPTGGRGTARAEEGGI